MCARDQLVMGTVSTRQRTTEAAAADPDIDEYAERILLVGPKGAGKSTLRKQLRRLHTDKTYTEDEMAYWKSIIYDNALQAMQKAVTMSGALAPPAGAILMERSTAHDPASLSIATASGAAEQTRLLILRGLLIEERSIGAAGANCPLHAFLTCSEGPLAPLGRVVAFIRIPSTTALIKSLWAEPVIQSIVATERHHFDGADYFLEKFDIIAADDYSPDAEDIVRARAPRSDVEGAGAAGGLSAMVEELKFTTAGSAEFILYDVADIAELDGVLASLPDSCTINHVIFVADLTAYDKVEKEENLMVETLVDFEMICERISKARSGSKLGSWTVQRSGGSFYEEPYWTSANLHLYLNKHDLFEFAIMKKDIRQSRKYFSFQRKYGSNYEEGLFMDFRSLQRGDRGQELEYFEMKFLQCRERAGVEQLYTHSLCSTDVDNVQQVFQAFIEVSTEKLLRTLS